MNKLLLLLTGTGSERGIMGAIVLPRPLFKNSEAVCLFVFFTSEKVKRLYAEGL